MSDCEQTPRDKLAEFVAQQPEAISKALTIADNQTVGQNYFLRMDKNVPEAYYPNMPKSAMPSENSSVPRVTVAPTLLGCFVGYFRAERDLVYSGEKLPGKEVFKGGYYLSRIPFELALKPDATLVPDQPRSNEHWLVTYDTETIEYKPEIIGKFFLSQVAYINTGGTTLPAINAKCWLHVEMEDFCLEPGVYLKPGYYTFDLFWRNLHVRTVQDEKALRNLTEISETDFKKQKELSATMLEFKKPTYSDW